MEVNISYKYLYDTFDVPCLFSGFGQSTVVSWFNQNIPLLVLKSFINQVQACPSVEYAFHYWDHIGSGVSRYLYAIPGQLKKKATSCGSPWSAIAEAYGI